MAPPPRDRVPPLLYAATVILAIIVVLLDLFVWRPG
jgi:hypothetical protein